MRKKNLKPVITGSVLIIPAILLGAGIGANAKSSLPKINTGSSGIRINQIKLPKMTPSTGGIKTIANKVMKTNPFKTSGSNVNNSNPNKFPVDRCNSINSSTNFKNNSNKGSLTSNNDPDFNPGNTGPVYENVLTVNTPSSNKGPKPTLSPKNRPLPPIPGSSSSGGSGKRPAYNPNKGPAPKPPSNVEPYRPGSTSDKNKLTSKQNNNSYNNDNIYEEIDAPIYQNTGKVPTPHSPVNSNRNSLSLKNNNNKNNNGDEPIYDQVYDPIYMNTGNFGESIYDIPN